MRHAIARVLLATSVMATPALQAVAADAPAVPATDALDEIVVTATKTGAESLQRTPLAISVVGGEQLVSQGLRNVHDLAQFVPNVTYGQNTASAEIYIRGIGSNNIGAGSDPDVTTQVDGVYIARPSGQLTDFLDVDRIEVLRGPQGTLYGRNAVGGTINVISRKPSNEFGGRMEVAGGNFGLGQTEAYLTGPLLADRLQGSLAFNYLHHDPYFRNIVGPDVGAANRGGGRLQLRWEPAANIDATTRMDLSLSDESFESYSNLITRVPVPALANALVGNFRNVALGDPQMMRTKMGGVAEEVNWQISEPLALKSITAWRTTRYQFSNDNDATEQQIQFSHQQETDQQVSQEFDLQYTRERFKGVTGLYFFHDQDHQTNDVLVPPSVATPPARALFNQVSPLVKSTSGAIFAQGTVKLTQTLSVTVGGRYTSENKKMDQIYTRLSQSPATPGVAFAGFPSAFHLSNDYSAFTPKLGLDWQTTDSVLLYVSATRGYKSGGFNFSAAAPSSASFQPEKLWSYEGGAKTQWLNERVRVNATAFYYDYTNLQVQQLIAAGVLSIGNAATARVKGAELELLAKPVAELQFTLNVAALDARYDRFTAASIPQGLTGLVANAVCVGTTCTVDASGNYLNSAPKFSALTAIDYSRRLAGFECSAHADYAWRARTYYDPSNVAAMSQGPYGLANAQIGLGDRAQSWRVQVWGKNLADRRYYVITSASGLSVAGMSADPRTFGIRLTHNW
jgi:iron complex outermembrane receptor protein